jgi:hypothetical protein
VTKIFEHCTIEIIDVIDRDLLRDSMTKDDFLPEKIMDGGRGYIGYGLRFNPFGEVLYYDNGEGVIPMCWCVFAHNIDAPPLQGSGWGYQL